MSNENETIHAIRHREWKDALGITARPWCAEESALAAQTEHMYMEHMCDIITAAIETHVPGDVGKVVLEMFSAHFAEPMIGIYAGIEKHSQETYERSRKEPE